MNISPELAAESPILVIVLVFITTIGGLLLVWIEKRETRWQAFLKAENDARNRQNELRDEILTRLVASMSSLAASQERLELRIESNHNLVKQYLSPGKKGTGPLK